MIELGVNIAIFQANQVLLTIREDFEVWCLPGGGVDPGESLAQAAIRESREETGLRVSLARLVGSYSRPDWRGGSAHIILFAAQAVGGTLQPQRGEVLTAEYFHLDELPEPLLLGHRQRIQDAVKGTCGAVWLQDVQWPFDPNLTRTEVYALRDRSGLSRREFYRQYVSNAGQLHEVLEVPDPSS